jgi:hypothetical protein
MTNSNHDWLNPNEPGKEHAGNHQRFLELCALATSGPLEENEASQLQAHLEECPECREAMAEFRFVAVEGASLLVPVDAGTDEIVGKRSPPYSSLMTNDSWSHEAMKRNLFARIGKETNGGGNANTSSDLNGRLSVPTTTTKLSWQQKLQYSVVLLVALGAVAVGSFRFGVVHVWRSHAGESRVDKQTPLLSERAALQAQLESRVAEIEDLASRLQERTAAVQELKRKLAETASLEASHDNELNAALAQNSSFVTERDSLLRKVQDSEASVVSLRGELDSLRAQRQGDLLRVSSLEARIEQLNGRLNESQETVAQQQDFLVSDRDIRELMGARSLYITDVVDVDKNGHTRKPFGRIFYTKGKSLVFYAFDLDQQRGLRNAAFQLWGQRGADRNGSVNMGIFYLDNEANRRWVLKFDNPEKLAQINAVFVTVEPNGGSHKPAGKQLLYASLRSLPNHP